MRLGALLEHEVDDVIHIVKPETYRTWIRCSRRGHLFKKLGRPGTPKFVQDLVCMMARANIRWGRRRISGELKKLGISIGATTIRGILKSEGLYPEPTKGTGKANIPWKTFIDANMESLVATDFFTKKVRTLYGTFDTYFLVFIHLGSRKVFCSPVTYHPNEEWVTQQARNAAMWMDDLGIRAKFLIHDRDTKFSNKFKAFWKDESVRCIKTPIRAPRANAYVENWIGGLKRECLNHLICFSSRQADYAVRTWVKHYNEKRPHRGKGMSNEVLDKDFVPHSEGSIKCEKKLGGLITEYYREAA